MFVIDTLNFCFWSDGDILFTVDYGGKSWTGYRALRAAFLKAMEVSEMEILLACICILLQNGVPIHKPSFYAEITQEAFANIFKSTTCESISMLKERTECLQEAGTVLMQVWTGDCGM